MIEHITSLGKKTGLTYFELLTWNLLKVSRDLETKFSQKMNRQSCFSILTTPKYFFDFKFWVFLSRQDRKTNSFGSFLGEVTARQFCFEIYWPLEGFMNKIHMYWQNWEREFIYLRTSLMLKFTYRQAKFNSEFWSHKRVKLFLKEHSKFHSPLLTSKFGSERSDFNWCRFWAS